MHYLHLRFENCGLLSCKPKKLIHIEKDKDYLGQITVSKTNGHDLNNPIPYTLLSNVIHVLCGEIPVPTNKKHPRLNDRLTIIDDIAKNSYIKYNHNVQLNDNGYPIQRELIQTSRSYFKCGKQIDAKFFYKNGEEIPYYKPNGEKYDLQGFYNWSYFRKGCKNKECFFKFIKFINSIVGYNVLNDSFDKAVTEISQYWENNDVKEKITKFITDNGKDYNKCWLMIFFHINGHCSNIETKSKTPLYENRGTTYITYLSGEIICPIDNEEIIKKLYSNEGFATLLEGGVVYIVGIDNYETYPNFREDFEKIK